MVVRVRFLEVKVIEGLQLLVILSLSNSQGRGRLKQDRDTRKKEYPGTEHPANWPSALLVYPVTRNSILQAVTVTQCCPFLLLLQAITTHGVA